jgi:cytochrome P450
MPFDFEYFRNKRNSTPVWLDPHDNVWNVYRYADVMSVLGDYATFSSDFSDVLEDNPRSDFADGNMLVCDPPRHQQLRGLVSQAFSPRAIARMSVQIEQVAEELLERTQSDSQIELIGQFAYPLPVTIIAHMLGVPASDRRRFKTWANALLDFSLEDVDNRARIEDAKAHIRRFHDYMRKQVERRRVHLKHDLLSDLITARIDDQQLTDSEIVGFAVILLIAGHITTTLLLGNAVLCLDRHPEVQEILRSDSSAIGPVLEETLRYQSPVRMTRRITTREVQLCGVRIPARKMVNVWLISANHDERQFECPDDFIFDRSPNAHVAFGRGIHFCLGAPLARLESTVALKVLLKRYTRLRLDPHRPPDMYPSPLFSGARRLHLAAA